MLVRGPIRESPRDQFYQWKTNKDCLMGPPLLTEISDIYVELGSYK